MSRKKKPLVLLSFKFSLPTNNQTFDVASFVGLYQFVKHSPLRHVQNLMEIFGNILSYSKKQVFLWTLCIGLFMAHARNR